MAAEAATRRQPATGQVPGMMRATFRGGYTMSFWVGDPATGEAKEFWHTTPDERVFTNVNAIQWAGDHVMFTVTVPNDEWERYFSVALAGPITAAPTLLTSTNGIIEDASSVALSKDGRTLFYTTNHGDIDRRHVWAVPTAGGTPKQVSTGAGIETSPMPLAAGTHFAALTADAKRPQSVGVFSLSLGEQKVIYPTLPASFPKARHVDPLAVTLKAADGFEFYNQLFIPADLKPGEKRPAMIFVHGGPVRQMLLGYHYRHFYHMAYAVNQWLASQGYIVMSVNFRSGVGYGRSFRRPPTPAAAATASIRTSLPQGSTCTRDPTWTRNASASGGCRTAACSRRRRSHGTRICSRPASISPASICGAARSIPPQCRFNPRQSERSTNGSRRSSSSTATTTATSHSSRRLASSSSYARATSRSSSSSSRTTCTTRCCTRAGCTRSSAWMNF